MDFQGIQPLFYSPLSVFNIEDHQTLNQQLVNDIEAHRSECVGVDKSNWKGWHSDYDFFRLQRPSFLTLQSNIIEAVKTTTRRLSQNFNLEDYELQAEGWINVLDQGGLNTPHDHPGWVWSGCYYVKVPKGMNELSGCIEFLDSRTAIRTLTVDGASCFESKYRVHPSEGMLLIFPAYLRHWVYPNDSDASRITIAFNFRYLKK